MSDSNLQVLHAKAVFKTFEQGDLKVDVLKNINFTVNASETIAIMGASGSGKSTLMHLLGGLDQCSAGEITICNHPVSQLSASDIGRVRNKHLGFMYQFHHLLPEFTALENVAMPLMIAGQTREQALHEAHQLVEAVGLAAREQHKPGELSGGERQRIALARALVTEPDCILADEPTGNLDRQSADQMMELLIQLNERIKTALVIVTHDPHVAEQMQSLWMLDDGNLTQSH